MSGALEGITVVALEQAVAAPLATSRLADAGARVIKLERLEGDFARYYDDYVLGQSSYFVWNNRSKESCTVNLRQPEDLALIREMIARADVFVQNLAPGATERLGIGSAALRNRYPRLITCDIAGFAAGTPDEKRKAYDLLIQAEAGLASITGTRQSGPARVGISICDIATGQAAYAAILQALLKREKTAQGTHIQLSLFDTMAEYLNVPYLRRRYGGREPQRSGLAHPSIAPYGVFSASDGDVLIAIQNEREWRPFCEHVLGNRALADDPRFDCNTRRVQNRAELDRSVQTVVARHTVEGLCRQLDLVRIAYGRISTMADLMAHPSATTTVIRTPAGPVELLASPVLFDGRRPVPGRVPALGEHNHSLRSEFGGTESRNMHCTPT